METNRSIEEILEDIAESLRYLVKLKELGRLGASYD
tara:strand:+ start:306 stop:413 length:108 start_codon:yes stop_codon:yes gene_type:complete